LIWLAWHSVSERKAIVAPSFPSCPVSMVNVARWTSPYVLGLCDLFSFFISEPFLHIPKAHRPTARGGAHLFLLPFLIAVEPAIFSLSVRFGRGSFVFPSPTLQKKRTEFSLEEDPFFLPGPVLPQVAALLSFFFSINSPSPFSLFFFPFSPQSFYEFRSWLFFLRAAVILLFFPLPMIGGAGGLVNFPFPFSERFPPSGESWIGRPLAFTVVVQS